MGWGVSVGATGVEDGTTIVAVMVGRSVGAGVCV